MQKNNSLYYEIVKQIVPSLLQQYFEISNIENKKDLLILYLEEKEDLIPKELFGKEVVKGGFYNSIELQAHPLGDKLLYFNIRRRKWKEKGTIKSYSNKYTLHRNGMKTTFEFGDFLKETLGFGPSEFNKLWTDGWGSSPHTS
jgi:hypothetical protein